MKLTYTKTTTEEKNRIEVWHDQFALSPRDEEYTDGNLGYFITKEKSYESPDTNEELQNIMERTAEEATDTQNHMELIKAEYKDIVYIEPVYRYEHGNVKYSRGTAGGFDSSNCGFYIVTKKTLERTGTETKDFDSAIDAELETYTAYANGETYGITIYDEDGEVQEQQGNFFSIEDMYDGLPKEFEGVDLNDYLT